MTTWDEDARAMRQDGEGVSKRPGRRRIGHGRACGSFGELLQGVLPDGDRDFLVTLPIDAWSTARFLPGGNDEPIHVWPSSKVKAGRLATTMLAAYGRHHGGRLEITSALPEGKGLASSSADLVATARAVADALGMCLSGATIEGLLRGIEPSDGIMHDGIVTYYHRESRLREHLGCLPPLTIVAVDEGGQVDTVSYNRVERRYTPRQKQEYSELLATLSRAVRGHDLATVGAVSTRSARLHTSLRPRRLFERLVDIQRAADAVGLVLAHSGTVIGVLIADDDPERDAKVSQVTAACHAVAGSNAVSVYASLCRATNVPASCPTQVDVERDDYLADAALPAPVSSPDEGAVSR